MKKFIVLYHAPQSAMEKMKDKTPEEVEKGMEAWHAWAKECGEHLVDLGKPLGVGTRLSTSGDSASDTSLCGYSILQAEDLEKAKALLKEHPHLSWAPDCAIECHPMMPLPGE